jgi:RNA recognition motif-containing protein
MNNNNRLFVAGLPFSSTEEEIRKLFSSVGKVVSVSIILDRQTNRSKGFGFVEMENADAARMAIEKINNTEFGGRKLIVALAKPQERREFKPRFGRDNKGFGKGNSNFSSDRRPSFGRNSRFNRNSNSRGGFSRNSNRSGGQRSGNQ